jgi:zinc protease
MVQASRLEPTREVTMNTSALLGLVRLRVLSLGVSLCAVFLLPAMAAAATVPVRSVEGITEYALPNGLQLLLAPDDSKPTTTVNLTVRVGSRHENHGETGMAHLLEHMLFKGSARHSRPWADFGRRGLRANGTTSLDRTNYFASFATNDETLAWYLGWLADAMVNSHVAKADLDTEMTVVRNEMESGENSPGRILFEKTLATMYQWHGYGRSTIGARGDVEGVDIERLRAFYRTWYRPDNATLIVAGRFDPARVRAIVEEAFGPIPRPAAPLPRLPTLDPVQDGEREVVLRRVGGSASLLVGYHGVPAAHPDHAAVELLTQVLADEPAGRLHQRLTQAGLAARTWGWAAGLHDPGFIVFGAQLAPGQDLAAARQALLRALETLADEPVTAEELERARTRWLNAWDQGYTDPEQVGLALSESVAQGDWRLVFLLRDRVREVSLAQVQRVAQERLLPANRTLGSFVPTPTPVRAPAPAAVDVAAQLQGFRPRAAEAGAEAFAATPQAIEGRVQRAQVGGLRVALLPKGTRGAVVQAELQLRVGDADSLRGLGVTAGVMADLLGKATAARSRQRIQDRLDELRAEVSFEFSRGLLSAQMRARRESFPALLELVAEMLRQPVFDATLLDESVRQQLAALARARTEPGAIVAQAVERHGNPYPRGDLRHAPSFDETEADLRALTPAALRTFHARFVGAGLGVFTAVGDFDPAAARGVLERAFAGWTAPQAPARVERPLWTPPPARLVFETPDKQNASLRMRQGLALTDRADDYPALLLANYLLGQGGQSRLWLRIREREGLSYDVGSWIEWNPWEPGSWWQIRAIFAPDKLSAVETALREEMERALREGFSPQEVAEGQGALMNLRRLSLAQDDVLAQVLARQTWLGETMARHAEISAAIEALTPEQVGAALRRHLRPDAAVKAVGGDFRGR